MTHFKELKKKTDIKYEDMLFFDDEPRNKEVEVLGVTFVLISRNGLTMKGVERGLKKWQNRRKANKGV